jgi:DNA-binding NtrC family response regulator
LRLAGYEVHEADNAERACDFDVPITDYCLGGKANELEVLNQFETITPGKQKFLMTGLDPTITRAQAEAIGAEFIEKPIALDNLLRVIEHFAVRQRLTLP